MSLLCGGILFPHAQTELIILSYRSAVAPIQCASPSMRHPDRCGLCNATPWADCMITFLVKRKFLHLEHQLRVRPVTFIVTFSLWKLLFVQGWSAHPPHFLDCFLNRSRRIASVNSWCLWCGSAGIYSISNRWRGAERGVHDSKHARNWHWRGALWIALEITLSWCSILRELSTLLTRRRIFPKF